MEERWWDLWAAECRRQLATFDLGWAPIVDGRTAVVCWTEGGGAPHCAGSPSGRNFDGPRRRLSDGALDS